jgi:signal transduction histidine kinase
MNGQTEPVSFGAKDSFTGGGRMGELMRSIDWSKTPIGAVESWSPSLRMMVSFLLVNRFPLLLWWGPNFCQIYNDPYRMVLGKKHPGSMGQLAIECWPEIWHIIDPLIQKAFHGGEATWMENIQVEEIRYDRLEEAHFAFAYSPVPDETVPGGIGGVMATVHETTDQVIGQRRGLVLRDLGSRSGEAKTAEQACVVAARTLAEHPQVVPFALFYSLAGDQRQAHLTAAAGIPAGKAESPLEIDLRAEPKAGFLWPLAGIVRSGSMQIVEDLQWERWSEPPGPWADPPSSAVVWPIRSNSAHRFVGFLVLGVSARLRFDDRYREFCELVTSQVAAAITNARAYEEERKRAEALADIDRAKTAFFSNVSHEFRAPLTLILGPLEDEIRKNPKGREGLEIAHRNSLRLLKLVNTLLDFARIEAGRVDAVFEPTDLAAATAELAGVFRSAIESAGLQLVVNCPSLPEEVYVDREMWEKIVLNLLSNAFKFTFEGEIKVTLSLRNEHAELAVSDTGGGIPAAELSHIFERFHRVRGTRSRIHEGTGIGLSLVQELARTHGGEIQVRSVEGQGATFIVTIPTGFAHLPKEQVGGMKLPMSSRFGAKTFVSRHTRSWDTPSRFCYHWAANTKCPKSFERLPLVSLLIPMKPCIEKKMGRKFTCS